MNSHKSDAPLTGVTVIEHGQGVSASYAGRLLALMGATVIKIEAIGGDSLRRNAPKLQEEFDGDALFAYLNVNKSGVTLNLSSSPGHALLYELLGRADVFLDDTHPAGRRALGIAPDEVCRAHPELIYASVLPFGALGPHSEYKGYELNVFHSGGEGYLLPNGLALELFPDRPPVKIYGHFAEFNGGTSAVCAVLAALLVQDQIGGQLVDVSVQDANVAISCFALQRLGEGVLEHRHARSFQYGGVLECADGYVQLLTLEQHQWEGLVKLMGAPAWALEPDLNDPIKRARRGREINQHIRAWAKLQRVTDVVQHGQALDVPLAKYVGPKDIMESEQTRARDMFVPVQMAGLGALPMLMAPFQYTLPDEMVGCAPRPGADNARILCEWLGHLPSELSEWTRAGAV